MLQPPGINKRAAEAQRMYEIQISARKLVETGKFDELERLILTYRIDQPRTAHGRHLLAYVYGGAAGELRNSSASDQFMGQHIAALEAWCRARPDSAAARLALAKAHRQNAWLARGSVTSSHSSRVLSSSGCEPLQW